MDERIERIMTELSKKLKEEDYAFGMWDDKEYLRIIEMYSAYRAKLVSEAKKLGMDDYEPSIDVPPHIRNWFENPIYQTLIKPSKSQILELLRISKWLTLISFAIGVVLLFVGLLLLFKFPSADPLAIISLVLSGTATILASLFKSATAIKDTAIQHAKLHISISAGMVSLDAMQRIMGHQEKLTTDELKTIQEITRALSPLIKAFERETEQD